MVKNILFVDDEPEFAEPQIEALSDEGYSVELLDDPEEVMQKLRQGSYDLIILDLLMPAGKSCNKNDFVETGVLLHQKIRTEFEKIPIIFLSVVRDPNVLSQITDLEKRHGHEINYVSKPAIPSDLVDTVQRILPSGDKK